MPTYTVLAVYEEPRGQRFATTVEAATPQAAEIAARDEAEDELIIAGVIEGEHELVDMYTDGCSVGLPEREAT